jgi:phosphatidate cytidylyltransferase
MVAWSTPRTRPSDGDNGVLKRTLTGAAVLAVLLGTWFIDRTWGGGRAWALAGLGAIVTIGALDELLVMGGAKPGRRALGRVLGVIWLMMMLLPALVPNPATEKIADLLTATSLVAAIYLALQLRAGPGPMPNRLAGILFFQVAYVGGITCLVSLVASGASAYVIGIVLVAKSSDIGAYFAGKAFGRHQFAPRVSPNKTWEGVVGGLLLPALLAPWLLQGVEMHPVLRPEGLRMPDGIPILALHGLVIGVLTVISDLSESLLKRSRAVKDSGTLFGASGGFLDLVDSLLLVGPCALAYTVFLVA